MQDPALLGSGKNKRRRVMKESVIVEIRAAEGGDDAKSLVGEQFTVYAKAGSRSGL